MITIYPVFPGYRVHERHSFLTRLLGVTKPEEDETYSTIVKLLVWSNSCTLVFGAAEVGMYFAYAFKVFSFYENIQKNEFSSIIDVDFSFTHGASLSILQRQK